MTVAAGRSVGSLGRAAAAAATFVRCGAIQSAGIRKLCGGGATEGRMMGDCPWHCGRCRRRESIPLQPRHSTPCRLSIDIRRRRRVMRVRIAVLVAECTAWPKSTTQRGNPSRHSAAVAGKGCRSVANFSMSPAAMGAEGILDDSTRK